MTAGACLRLPVVISASHPDCNQDVRPGEEYEAAHIPGALSIPLEELRDRLSELPGDREIVAYCRGAYCVLAYEAVDLLHATGRKAARLNEGILEWRLGGLPVESGTAA